MVETIKAPATGEMNIKEVNINMERGTTDRGVHTKKELIIIREANTIKEATMDVGQLHKRLVKHYICFIDKKVICSKLPDPDYGYVKVDGLYPGDKAVYKCNVGYVLVGLDTRKCLSDGKWSGEAPICKRESYMIE